MSRTALALRDCGDQENDDWSCRAGEASEGWDTETLLDEIHEGIAAAGGGVLVYSEDPGVPEFCARRGITAYLERAVHIALATLSPVNGARVTLEEDMETGDQYAVINLDVRGSTAEVLRTYRQYLARIVAAIPAERAEAIRLAYNRI